MKRIALLITALVTLSSISQAHQDTPLKLEGGKITGLPKKYQPATFDRKNKILTIAGRRLAFPKVLHKLFTDDRVDELYGDPQPVKGHPYQLKISASWYHGADVLPPYMFMRIEPQDRDYAFELLIDMDRLSFIEANIQIATVGSVPIDLDGVVDTPHKNKGEQDSAGQAPTRAESK